MESSWEAKVEQILSAGLAVVTVALIIVTRIMSVGQFGREPSPFFIIEAALEMLPMMYCILCDPQSR